VSQRCYAVLGTGAVGGFYGARLQRAGSEVHFLCHRDLDQVRQRGLRIESCEGDFTLSPVNAYGDVQEMPACDVVIVALKTTQNHLLPSLLPPVLKDDGIVLLLQNGLGGEEWVAELVGSDRVMAGLCFISSNKIGPGHIAHLDYGFIQIADYASNYQPQGITSRMRQIKADFEQAGIAILMSEDLLLARWQKLVWNIPFNGLSVVLNATTDQMMADPHVRLLVEKMMGEVVQGAAAYGRQITSDFAQDMLRKTEKMAPYRTSMMLDYKHHRPLEVEAIVGNPLRAAQKAGVTLPRIEMIYHQLLFLDAHHPVRPSDLI
jgi:2-dehydropantoate 2-reductase